MALDMTIRELGKQRQRFHLAPGATNGAELPLIEKQALIDEILRGVPINSIEYYDQAVDGEVSYMVTKGYPQITAILDFMDGKFRTWTDAEMRQYMRNR